MYKKPTCVAIHSDYHIDLDQKS